MKKIKKILIYSRHGLRYPLFKKEEMIELFKKDVINWEFEDGILTSKGEILEYQFAKFLKKYIEETGLTINKKEIRSNSLQRTVLTAKLFALAMYPFENLKVDYQYDDLKTYEEEFNLKVDRKDLENSEIHLSDIEIEKIYMKLEDIAKLNRGDILNMVSSSDLTKEGYVVSNGKFKVATDIVDSYILKYYDGFNENEIFESSNFKKDLSDFSIIKDRLLDLLFANKKYIRKSRLNPYKLLLEHLYNDKDLSIIVGHDSNLATILSALNLENLKIGNEFEKYPIGAKLIFKLYEDETLDIDYAFYNIDQIRNLEYEKPIIQTIAKNMKLEVKVNE